MAKSDLDYTNRIIFHKRWHPFICLGNHMYIMTCHCLGGVKYAPLYIHSFQLLQPRRLLEAERFNIKYTDPLGIATVADKLRYYRHKKALRQRDVAEKTGIHLATYCAYEQEDRKIPYPFDKLVKLLSFLALKLQTCLIDITFFYIMDKASKYRCCVKA